MTSPFPHYGERNALTGAPLDPIVDGTPELNAGASFHFPPDLTVFHFRREGHHSTRVGKSAHQVSRHLRAPRSVCSQRGQS